MDEQKPLGPHTKRLDTESNVANELEKVMGLFNEAAALFSADDPIRAGFENAVIDIGKHWQRVVLPPYKWSRE